MDEADLFSFAKARVANKGVAARIGHSAAFHSVRSAFSSKGSAVSKAIGLAGVAGRAALTAIPVPAIGSLIGTVEKAVEKYVRSRHHVRRGTGAAPGSEEQVKFDLKELSVDELDRYRWKVKESLDALNTTIGKLPTLATENKTKGSTCNAYVELAMAVEQADRRIKKLQEKAMATKLLMEHVLAWADTCDKELLKKRNESAQYLSVQVAMGINTTEADIIAEHGQCSDWCCRRSAAKPDNMAAYREKAAAVTKVLASPFVLDDVAGGIASVATPSS